MRKALSTRAPTSSRDRTRISLLCSSSSAPACCASAAIPLTATSGPLPELGKPPAKLRPSDVNALAAFVKATGWQCLYGINLGGAGPAPYTSGSLVAATTPTLAAEEIAYAYQAFGSSLFGFEIGNECDLYGSSYFSGATWNLSTFEALWTQFRAAIVAQRPAVAPLCTGPADAGSESSWTVPFGQYATKSDISLLTQHYYRGNGQSAEFDRCQPRHARHCARQRSLKRSIPGQRASGFPTASPSATPTTTVARTALAMPTARHSGSSIFSSTAR